MMKRLNRNSNDPPLRPSDDPANDAVYRGPEIKCGSYSYPMNLTRIFIVCSTGLFFVFFSLSAILWDSSSDAIFGVAEARVLELKPQQQQQVIGLQDDPPKSVEVQKDKRLGGLLAGGFDERSCLSRHQSLFYRKESAYKPSPYLISRLRSYEALHKQCGPHTESYNKTLEQIKTGKHADSLDCNYVVWISFSGLGNRILTLASAFLYALLTNRVLLVDRGVDMADLFCEPFPNASWLLPSDFPLTNQFNNFDQKSSQCYGHMLKNNLLGNSTPPFIYLHLVHDYDDQDKLFFCDQDQMFFKKVPWLIMKTDNYFTPSLFLIPSFEQELSNLFPEKETVFHFLGRYLLHPTNPVWGLITRFYQAYLAKADEKIGIQIRVFDTGPGPFQYVLDQLLNCIRKENLLPKITKNETITNMPQNPKTKAVLMTSLSSGYYEKIMDIYWEQTTMTGEVIGVYQPSNEGYQQTEKKMHNRKAWAEMYLLSLTDKLVTSSWSTFGYVAQGLGGLKPWILYKPENQMAPDPPCCRAMSMEPCFHAPPFYDCKKKTGINTGVLVPHVRHCEDMSWGLKLVNREN